MLTLVGSGSDGMSRVCLVHGAATPTPCASAAQADAKIEELKMIMDQALSSLSKLSQRAGELEDKLQRSKQGMEALCHLFAGSAVAPKADAASLSRVKDFVRGPVAHTSHLVHSPSPPATPDPAHALDAPGSGIAAAITADGNQRSQQAAACPDGAQAASGLNRTAGPPLSRSSGAPWTAHMANRPSQVDPVWPGRFLDACLSAATHAAAAPDRPIDGTDNMGTEENAPTGGQASVRTRTTAHTWCQSTAESRCQFPAGSSSTSSARTSAGTNSPLTKERLLEIMTFTAVNLENELKAIHEQMQVIREQGHTPQASHEALVPARSSARQLHSATQW